MVLGKLRYKIRYESAAQKLHVTVVQCQNLPKKDVIGASDPFVRVFLMPGTHAELKTKVVKKELNPTYNDEFSFVLSPTDVQKKTIVFQVFDWERFSANDGIGEVQVPLWPPSVDLAMETDRWEELEKITSDKNKKPILKQKRPAAMRSHSTASSVSSVRSSISSKHDAGRASVNSMHDVGRSSVSSMQDVGRATSGQGFHHQESSGTGFNQGGSYQYEEHTTTSTHQTTGNTSSSSSSSGNSTPARRPTTLSGNLSLHELNNRLERYIQQIRLEPEGNPTIINYERHTEGGSFDITSLPQYKEWESLQMEYLKQEEEMALVESEIEMYKQNNKDLKDRNVSIEKQIREIEASISAKRIRIQELEEKLRTIEMERQRLEKTRMTRETELAELQSQINTVPDGWVNRMSQVKVNNVRASINTDKRDFITRLSNLEWVETRTTQSINTQEIHDKIKKDYDDRLKEELEKMRLLYGSQLSEVKLSIEKIYSLKIKELTGQRNEWNGKAKAEVDEILARLRNAKRQIIELEEQKLKLTQKERELGEKLEEDESSYKAMLAAKKKEIEFLEQEYNSLYMEYGKFEKEKASYSYEVKRYNDLIKPAEERVTRHAEQFIEVGVSKADTSSSSSSSSEDEEIKMRKGSSSHGGVTKSSYSYNHSSSTGGLL
eukprot:TRINITY_DN1935_c0_g1_i5.p1 TRINITY_DN1935_c0_g1~~TRINITY_DN1935_c0_g1_i5.p1  ORF type:complete len:663 (-),score=240.20 TRINITY_DN1935_c0_g1_i5:156-2144(-)